MKEWAIFQLATTVVNKIADVVCAKKRADEKKRKAIIVTVICLSVVFVVAIAAVAAVMVLKKKGKELDVKALIAKIKAKFVKEEEACEGFEEPACEEVAVDFE